MSRRLDGIRRVYKRSIISPSPVQLTIARVKVRRTWRHHSLSLAIVALTGTLVYLVAAPYAPSIYFHFHPPVSIAVPTVPVVLHDVQPTAEPAVPYFGSNVITIGSIGVQSDILEGIDENTLENGLWRRPNSSTPELGGNTVIAGHRYKYISGPNTFYNLDKVAVGEPIAITWKGKLYTYKVSEILTVGPNDSWIEQNTSEPLLTLYTCTPLWSSSQRLVVRATLQS